MRIIAGEKRSRKIEAPQGQDTRPTADRVKEALFSMLQRRLYDARVLDLYAGSGALSLEALSRGAKSAVLVDMSFKAGKVIRQNIETLDYGDRARFLNMEDMRAISHLEGQGAQFDLIFLDPPYRMNTTETCARLAKKLLAEGGIIICEHDRKTPPDIPEGLQLYDRREYGITGISFFTREGEDG
ncbi:MAG: 16S rRNA (guanine(966)-N(2))-methyltransferase RsmD [Clostridia bacterium]|nr:16S rRNA (guanine(966)-N(2))-methyltransferase RsmD [Clostridia bacterium]